MSKPNLKVRFRFVFALLFTLLAALALIAPAVYSAKSSAHPGVQAQQEFQRYFRKYEVAQLARPAVADQVRKTGSLSISTPSHHFELELALNDLRAANYRAEEVTEGGTVREIPSNPIRTYKGRVLNFLNATARFTIDDSTFEGMIITPDEWYFVESALKYQASASADDYVVYKASDVIADPNMTCGATLKEQIDLRSESFSATLVPEAVSPTRVAELATEADFDYVTDLGGSAAANNEILSIMNQVQGIYEAQLGLTFSIVFQHTWATSSDPYTITGDASGMLNEFTNYWNANFTGTTRDVAHMWTGRSMNAAGIAWLGVVCNAPNFSYGLSVRTTTSTFRITLPAHEIGHNFNATHSDSLSTCASSIMQAVATPSTTLNFCQFSIDEITNFANGHSSCLSVFTAGPQIRFSAPAYSASEGTQSASLTVTRTGATTGVSTVDFVTADGTAQQRSDYTIAAGTIDFAAGETSKTITLPISDDLYVEGDETLSATLSNPTGATLSSPGTATLTITNNDSGQPATNPLDTAQFFVRQHYYDFLSRLPDQGGLDYWSNEISSCGSDQNCIRARRKGVSNAFFYELEFQQTGAYVYRLCRAAYGNDQPSPNPDTGNVSEARKIPSYTVFVRDRARVVGGANLAQSQLDLANAFVQRAEFLARYPASLSGPQFVDALLARIGTDSGVNLGSQRSALINLLNQGGRGAVLYRLADDNLQTNPISNRPFVDAEYTRSFVYTQYAGYLRRDADIGGFLFWLQQVNRFPVRDSTIQQAMVCAFITSAEYQQRFSPVVTHSNSECGN